MSGREHLSLSNNSSRKVNNGWSGIFEENFVEDIVIHIDVDSFYTEAECLRDPSLRGKPFAVRQGNSGGFVAVSYEARALGVRKGDGVGARGRANIAKLKDRVGEAEAIKNCNATLIVRDMDTEYYRFVSDRLASQIQEICHGMVVEKASIDDFFVLFDHAKYSSCYMKDGYCPSPKCSPQKALIAIPARGGNAIDFVSNKSGPPVSLHNGYYSSDDDFDEMGNNKYNPFSVEVITLAQRIISNVELPVTIGISSTKLLSKLVGGLKKPKGFTILSPTAIDVILRSTPLRELPGFRGKFGEAILNCSFIPDGDRSMSVFDLRFLKDHHLKKLKKDFGSKRVEGLRDVGRGIDNLTVESRGLAKMVISEKSFPPNSNFQAIARLLSRQLIRRLQTERPDEYPLRLVFKWRHGYTSLTTTASKTILVPTNLRKQLTSLSRKMIVGSADDLIIEIEKTMESIIVSTVPNHCEVTRLLIGVCQFVSMKGKNVNSISTFLSSDTKQQKKSSTIENTRKRAHTELINEKEGSVTNKMSPKPHEIIQHQGTFGSGIVDRCDEEPKIICPICSQRICQNNANAHVESHFITAAEIEKRKTTKISTYFKRR